ncbi:TPA: FemA/FemB family glycyltransferase FmhC [Staphylococcus aureus]|uniref:FemA/FemB family glycyltransferase FmhC n=2 Tax=Staphylococcus TaxID=1279 RepID=UPI000F5EBC06|nr:FemA/FemB family glycyltransferase FmhC [Staphylococcus aureus]MCJ8111127.1 FemA/FemB family glycyltransferase FmhC [Staphylococcus aureus]QHK49853.1 FemA/FemB family glycyltransferase FmhC [Staphylococcus aureus]RQX53446.1 FemA/FemB family glycyltransferase FmhC [Staphylococcus aureus]HBC4296145.1 FemA/FemB family glycyltransferase FmhC [Staphylococcus aureus]HCV3557509.1 FemA/FemB family glycyltransferase FmhC [Staphylococcus aureus]
MKFSTLSEEEFTNYTKKHFKHYTQSIELYNYRNKINHEAHIVGVKNDKNEVIAACLLTEARIFKFYKYFYSHRGPLLDYFDAKLVCYFFKELSKFIYKNRGVFILVDPYLIENLRDANGRIIKNYNNSVIVKMLGKIGYLHQGYTTGYSNKSQIRWISVLDLKDKDENQLLKEMEYQTRRNIKKTIEIGVKVEDLSIEETNRFYKLFQMAEEKHGFHFMNEDYFKRMQEIYKDKAKLKIACIDLNEYQDKLKIQLLKIENEMMTVNRALNENPNSKKNKSKLNQLNMQLSSINNRISKTEELILEDGPVLDLDAALFICTDDEVYYLSSGSNPKYNQYMGAYHLQWHMIKYAKAHNINRYNFYGITGVFSNEADDFGVQQFKKGFNAHVEELIGDFIKPVRPILYKFAKLIYKV